MKLLALILLAVLESAQGAATRGKLYNFEFKEMDLKKVVTSIAKLEGKSVLFSQGVEPRPVEISLTDVSASFALKLILDNYGYVGVEKGGVIHVVSASERGPASNSTVVFPMQFVVAKEIEPNVKAYIGDKGSVTSNQNLNSLIVNAPPETLSQIQSVISQLDQESSQVYIEAKVVETSTTFARALGIEWGKQLNSRSNGISFDAQVGENTFIAAITDFSALQARLTAGERNGQLKVISNPKVTTLNGVTANIESTTSYSIRTLAQVTNGATTGGVQTVRAGITLRVTPYIVSQKQVRLALSLSKSDPDFSQSIDGIPGISDNSANTSLIIRSGQTASIGGLIHHSASDNHTGIPFLSNIPILGGLFRNSEKEKKSREILIFLTPTIFKNESTPKVPAEKVTSLLPPPASKKTLPDTEAPDTLDELDLPRSGQ